MLTDSGRIIEQICDAVISGFEVWLMMRASIYIGSITALAAVLAIIATGITTQWQREHRATQVHSCSSPNSQELLTRDEAWRIAVVAKLPELLSGG